MAEVRQNKKRERFNREAMIHLDALMRSAKRLTKSESEAEDLVQETMLKAYRFFDRFEEGTNSKAWLFKIMHNIFINNYRSKVRAPKTVAMDDIQEGFLYDQVSQVQSPPSPEQQFFSKIIDEDVRGAINQLPEDFRLVVVLSFLEGFSYQEIADITGLQIGTVKSRLHRGRKLLQKALWDYAVKNDILRLKDKSYSNKE